VARPINDFVQLARLKGPYGAAQADAELSVRQTVIDLCERAGVWKQISEFTLQGGVPDYPIDVPALTRLVAIDMVELDNTKYKLSLASRVCTCGGWNISVPDDITVLFHPMPYPACEVWVRLHLWLAPLLDCCEFPDLLYEEHSETIAWGVASRLLQQPKQEYTNQGLANRCFNLYEAGVTRAKNKRVLEHTTGPLMMRGGYF
jgi:hypothetical protein